MKSPWTWRHSAEKLLIKAESMYFNHMLIVFLLNLWSEHMSKTSYLFVSPAIPLGLIVVPGDSDLETCREHIQRLQEVSKKVGILEAILC